MACLDNVQIVQTVTYSSTPDTVNGLVAGQIQIDILNIGALPVTGTITVDKIRATPLVDLFEPPVEKIDNITSSSESFLYDFYYSVSNPETVTINATVEIKVNDCLYQSSCNHILLTPNESSEESSCTIDVQGVEAVSGCTSDLYYEYNPLANVDDGSCVTLIPILGCTNPLALNYNSLASHNDGTCIFSSGCTNPIANNYDSSAVVDDGSCECGDINVQLDFFNTTGESFALTGNCDFFIEFDLITKIDCEKFLAFFENDTRTILQILNSLKINAQMYNLLDENGKPIEYFGGSIDFSGNPEFLLVQEENIFTFDINNNPTGLGLTGGADYCETFFDLIATELGLECQDYDKTSFDVTWKSYKIGLNSDLLNTFTKFNLNFEQFRFGISVFIDNLKISSVCTDTYQKCTLIPSVFGFDLERVIDNKKAWVTTNAPIAREYNQLDGRETNYTDYDSRLIFNTKELELQVNPQKYIQKDVIEYFDFFGKFYRNIDERLLTMTIDKAKNEMIDVKNRQTIRSYSFLPTIYEQYLDGLDCAISKKLHYSYGFEIIERTGSLWHQMVSQIIPTTAIWQGNQYILKNNVFDIQKHKYKRYSLDVGTGGDGENCAPSGVTISCERISNKCFDDIYDSIDELLISGVSDLICEKLGDSVCLSDFQGDGSFSGKIIHYNQSGDTIEVLDLFGYQNYNCFTGDSTPTGVTIVGCTNHLAINYNPLANVDDGSCIICPPYMSGCTYSNATNFDDSANVDNGTCIFLSGVTGVTCTEDVSDFSCNLEYIDNTGSHTFAMLLTSPTTYSGGLLGSWTISGLNHTQPIQSLTTHQTYIQDGTFSNIPVNFVDYLEFGFNQLTPIGVGATIAPPPPANTDSPWIVGVSENLDLPLFTTANALNVTINVNFVTDSGCIFTGSANITLGEGSGVLVSKAITLTKVFP